MGVLVGAVDCGTSAVKAAIVDLDGRTLGVGRRRTPCTSTPDGRVEQGPESIVRQVLAALREAVAKAGVAPGRVAAISLSTQRATFLAVDRAGHPIGRAVSWQDARGAEEAARFRARIDEARYRRLTGLPLNSVFTLSKLLWMLAHDAPRARAARFVLVHDWVMHRLGVPGFVADLSNASLTGLLDVAGRRWCDDVLHAAGLEAGRLSDLVPSGRAIGALSAEAATATGLRPGTPLVSGGGDQQCAGLGAGAVGPGRVEVTLGTAAVPLCWAARPADTGATGLMCCVHADPDAWELEGFQNSAGSALAWAEALTGNASLPPAALSDRVAAVPAGARGVQFHPYLYGGSSAPHWNADATGMLVGLTHAHDADCVLRAVLEGICYETRHVLDAFEATGLPVEEVRVTGGCTRVDQWNRILADVSGRPVRTLENRDASLVGAAILAALGAGAFPSVAAAADAMVRPRDLYVPQPEAVAAYTNAFRRYARVGDSFDGSGIFAALRGREE